MSQTEQQTTACGTVYPGTTIEPLSTSPLVMLIADVLYQCSLYRMAKDVAELLERDAELLAAMQRLVLLVVQEEASRCS